MKSSVSDRADAASAAWRTARSEYANAVRHHAGDSQRIEDAKRALLAAEARVYAINLVDGWPAPDENTLKDIAVLLHPGE